MQLTEPTIEDFATKLQDATWNVVGLWKPDGSMAASIQIRKQIILDKSVPAKRRPVFHLYSYLEPTAFRVNHPDESYQTLDACMAAAKEIEAKALATGQWVYAHAVRDPRRRKS